MGLLETRSLHLENMIYLSAQEGVLPPSKYKSTLIPFTLRRGFKLPIGGTDDMGQDYTFFQSISRAKYLIFVVAPADAQRAGGEESRYINLLRYVYGVHIETQTLQLTSERCYLKAQGRRGETPPPRISYSGWTDTLPKQSDYLPQLSSSFLL